MDELTLDGKIYVSSKRAAKITGYARDYVGQLCREGHVEARLVGRNWYVLETSIKGHRFGVEEQKKETVAKELTPEPKISPIHAWQRPTYVAEPLPTMLGLGETAPQNASVNAISSLPITSPDHPVAQMQSAWQDWFAKKGEPVLNSVADDQSTELLLESPEILDARAAEETPLLPSFPVSGLSTIKTDIESDAEVVTLQKVAEVIEKKYDQEPLATHESDESVPLHRNYAVKAAPMPVVRRAVPQTVQTLAAPTGRIMRERRVTQLTTNSRTYIGGGTRKPSHVLQIFFLALAFCAVGIAFIGTGHVSGLASEMTETYPALQFLGGERTISK